MIGRFWCFGGLLSLGLLAPRGQAAEVPLTVDWNGVSLAQPFPVTGGVPFARGTLQDARQVRLLVGGREVPLQTEVLAWWPDHSVKWLLLDFQAAGGRQDFLLQYGEGTVANLSPQGITASEQDGSVTVDTGALKFRVRSDGSGFVDELWFEGTLLFEAAGRRLHFMDALHTASPADYPPMARYLREGQEDPSKVRLTEVKLEKAGPLHAVVRIDGRYTYQWVGSTITGTEIQGDCPFRIRLHAYAGQSFLKVEHFFYYEGDGDHDFVRSLGLKVPLPPGASGIRFIADAVRSVPGPLAGLYQQSPDCFEQWNSDGRTVRVAQWGRRFEGVLDVTAGAVSVAVGVQDFWQNAVKSLHADLRAGELGIYLWPPESPPLDFRRHAREWSVGETGEPDDREGSTPVPFQARNYRLASKGVGKTHYAWVDFHLAAAPIEEIRGRFQLFNRRPLLWASPHYYAASLALGRYREYVPGEHEEIEKALDQPVKFWKFSQDYFRWYGFWRYGNLCQGLNNFLQIGRWEQEFGRWGWVHGDSLGRLAYALMLQAVRKGKRDDLEFAEKYLYNVHDVCSVHTPAYPEHFGEGFAYFKGAAHRHGAWPWACPYTGIRGAHPVGAKIFYYLTGEGHVKDILEEITQLSLRRPDGGMGDGPLGPNAQIFLYQWEATGEDIWRERLKAEIENSGLKEAKGGWLVMMNAAFGIYNALEEYMDLTGDQTFRGLATRFADEALPEKMKQDWTRLGYYRVYACAYNLTRAPQYRQAIEEMLPLYLEEVRNSVAFKLPEEDWPGPAGGPPFFADGNCIRDIPFALYSLHLKDLGKEGK